MKTKVYQVNLRDRQRTARAIDHAAKEILAGQVVVYPTETAYGLGADATNPNALENIYELKKRDAGKPLPVIVSDIHMMRDYGVVNPVAEALAHAFMPGPLTLVVDKTDKLPDKLSKDETAFRIPSSHFARGLVSAVGRPITSTSANESGSKPLYSEREIVAQFDGKVPVILTAGDLAEVPPSTIVDTRTVPPTLRREGPIPYEEVLRQFKKLEAKPSEATQ